ncbi:MAG: hypothetical protein ACKO91_06890 [Acidimicrobiales bacterium]
MAALLAMVAAAVPVLGWRAVDTIRSSRAGTVEEVRERPRPLPDTPAVVVALADASSRLAGVLVVAMRPDGGGTLLALPSSSETVLVEGGDASALGSSWATGRLDGLAAAVGSLLRVEVSDRFVLAEATLAELLAPVAPFDVTFAADVRAIDAAGRERVVQAAGTRRLSGPEAAQVLFARGVAEPELARIGRNAAVWTAVAARLDRSATEAAAAAVGSVEGLVRALRRGPVRAQLVPVVADVSTSSQEVLRLDEAELRLVVAEVLPGAASPANGLARVRVVDPTGDRALLKAAVAKIMETGLNVVLAQLASGSAPSVTRLELDTAASGSLVDGLAEVIGSVQTSVAVERIEGVQATIVLGDSFRRFLEGATATATTMAPEPGVTTTLRRP